MTDTKMCDRCHHEPVALVDGDEFLCYSCYQDKHGLGPPRDVFHEDLK